ncbi:tyrosine-type recombinase/integrase [Shewanella sp. 202IG2-18]|uniref:tyrosine-type recombinase/integrase n=1 Tax=Parashewanella hymeniacidonis TaxID=2807618 RepID=UPI0019611016|nr:tyrosine-type recombinase/integrase [Parashewanella hymeniacidonis]MBM7072671.1 tyrosine-type recombinase/integrase [Parashewanella hymeniacidonis]
MKIEPLNINKSLPIKGDNSTYYSQLQHPNDGLKTELQEILSESPSQENNEKIQSIVTLLLSEFTSSLENEYFYSDNSKKSIQFNWNKFVEWCSVNSERFLPSSVITFERFLIQKSKTSKANSLQIFIWAVNSVHEAAGLPSPTKSARIRQLLKGIKKQKSRTGEVISQVAAFKEVHLDKVIELWSESNKLADVRNLALLCFSYETLLRESELARIKFSDLSFSSDGRAILTIPFTKTNHSGLADKVMLSRECINILKNYINKLNSPMSGVIFRPILKSNKVKWHNNLNEYEQQKPLSGYSIDKIFQKALVDIKQFDPFIVHNIERWSGHSARVGACQDLLAKGHSHIAAQQSGRWSSIEMVYRYGRDILAEDGAMIKSRWDR